MQNDFTEALIIVVNKQAFCVTIFSSRAPYVRQAKDGEAAEEVCHMVRHPRCVLQTMLVLSTVEHNYLVVDVCYLLRINYMFRRLCPSSG